MTGNSRNFGSVGLCDAGRSRGAERLGRASGRHADDRHAAAGAVCRACRAISAITHRSFHGFFVTDDLNRTVATSYESYTLTAPQDSRLADGGGYPVTVFVPTAAANALGTQTILRRESFFGDERQSTWDGFEVTVNARMRRRSDDLDRHQHRPRQGQHVRDGDQVQPGHERDARHRGWSEPARVRQRRAVADDPRRVGQLHGSRRSTCSSARVLRSRAEALLGGTPNTAATWQVPNSVIAASLGHLPAGATATGTTNIPLGDNEHRIYADNRRTQLDMRFAKILRFGRTSTDIGVDVNNVTNANYALGYNNTYVYGTDNTPRPSGWGTPTSIVNPRFVRLNFTVNF